MNSVKKILVVVLGFFSFSSLAYADERFPSDQQLLDAISYLAESSNNCPNHFLNPDAVLGISHLGGQAYVVIISYSNGNRESGMPGHANIQVHLTDRNYALVRCGNFEYSSMGLRY